MYLQYNQFTAAVLQFYKSEIVSLCTNGQILADIILSVKNVQTHVKDYLYFAMCY